jgi:hypothetical protein
MRALRGTPPAEPPPRKSRRGPDIKQADRIRPQVNVTLEKETIAKLREMAAVAARGKSEVVERALLSEYDRWILALSEKSTPDPK